MRAAGLAMPALLLASACSEPMTVSIGPEEGIENWSGYFPRELNERAFICDTSSALNPPRHMTSFFDRWYAGEFASAGEAPLHDRAGRAATTLRFLWLRSFHDPIVIRIEGRGDRFETLSATRLGDARGTVVSRLSRPLTMGESDVLQDMLAATRLREERPVACDYGLDGSRWVVEMADSEGYRLIDRWSPAHGPVRQVGERLIGLTGWDVGEVY